MPVEFALFAPGPISVEEQRGIAEVMNPPLVATQTRDGGTLEFTEFDGTPVITLGRARVVETQADLRRVFRHEVEVPDDTTCWYEGWARRAASNADSRCSSGSPSCREARPW
ncbi:hypothetical protein AB3K78_15955 [Leucobacter sp. HNU]|uniref:hypothetical protein n=1 Tax=Leucobacter sp. HNU TaxID=3236805 RepID=UPI003A802C79